MRFMVITKATENSEAGVLPASEEFEAAGTFIEEMMDAGVLLAAEGITPSSEGVRIYFDGGKATVVDGPFTETKELVAGFYLVEMKSLEECVEWFRRYPVPGRASGTATNFEIRRVYQDSDLVDVLTDEQRAAVAKRDEKAIW